MELKQLQTKATKMAKLLADESFNELIVEDFIKNGIFNNAIHNSLDSSNTLDELKARQILHKYIFDVITYAETAQK